MWRTIAAAVFALAALGKFTALSGAPSTCNHGPTAGQLARFVDGRDGVVAVVGDSPISTYELTQRMAWRIATLNRAPGAIEIARIERQERGTLISERHWVSLAQSRGITVAKSELDRRLDEVLRKSGMTERQLHNVLWRTGVDKSILRARLAAELARERVTGIPPRDDLRMPPQECF